VEQYVRDARIAQIYEGTNGVQARPRRPQAVARGRRVAAGFFDRVAADLTSAASAEGARNIASATAEALAILRETSRPCRVPTLTGSVLPPSTTCASSLWSASAGWARMAAAARAADTPLHISKVKLADWYAAKVLPQAHSLAAQIAAGADTLALAPDEF
jgi:hypothetical protein